MIAASMTPCWQRGWATRWRAQACHPCHAAASWCWRAWADLPWRWPLALSRRWLQKARPVETDQPNLNRRGSQYVGRRIGLVTPIVNGRGRAKLGDSSWTVTGPDLPAGEIVEVVGVEGTVLEVRQATDPTSESAA